MKRYHVKDGGWGYEADDGLWVDYDDAMAEIDALKAEVSKLCAELTDAGAKELALHNQLLSAEAELAALKAPPKVLSAQEVAEPGWYWHIERGWGEWHIHRIVRFGVLDDLHTMESDYSYRELHGQFIGPIQMPEV